MDKNTLLNRMRAMMETNMANLSSHVDNGRRDRAKDVTRKLSSIERNSEGHAVLVWDTKTNGSGHRYKCYIAIEPDGATLFQLAHAASKIRAAMQLIKNADVKCFCTCKDFQFSGAEYNMKHKHDALEIDHSTRASADMAPSVRDPHGKNTLCKHLYSCFNGILTSAPIIMSKARNARFPESEPVGDQTMVGNTAPKEDTDGNAITMNSSQKPDTSTTGKITTLNGGKAIAENPGDAKAITILGNSAPVEHTPEIGEALDALATTLNSAADANKVDDENVGGDIDLLNTSDSEEAPTEEQQEATLMNSSDKSNGIFDLEDSIDSGMFNNADDEEEM